MCVTVSLLASRFTLPATHAWRLLASNSHERFTYGTVFHSGVTCDGCTLPSTHCAHS
jgi:hypothetical protein